MVYCFGLSRRLICLSVYLLVGKEMRADLMAQKEEGIPIQIDRQTNGKQYRQTNIQIVGIFGMIAPVAIFGIVVSCLVKNIFQRGDCCFARSPRNRQKTIGSKKYQNQKWQLSEKESRKPFYQYQLLVEDALEAPAQKEIASQGHHPQQSSCFLPQGPTETFRKLKRSKNMIYTGISVFGTFQWDFTILKTSLNKVINSFSERSLFPSYDFQEPPPRKMCLFYSKHGSFI